jgi:hypothetical protein
VVEGGGLENRFRESERGFESYLLRERDMIKIFGEMTERPKVADC